MKTASVKAYMHTGFTGINVPDSPDVFKLPFYQNNVKELQVINCLPLSGEPFTSIRVKDFSGIEDCDYIEMKFNQSDTAGFSTYQNYPYFAKVTGYKYLSSDTVELYLAIDYWLSLGGIKNIQTISGITSRVHIPKADDKIFKYTEPDEMINPVHPLEVVTEELDVRNVNRHYADRNAHVVMCTLDLFAIGYLYSDFNITAENPTANAVTLKSDPENANTEEFIVVPKLMSIGDVNYDASPYSDLLPDDGGIAQGMVRDYPYGRIVMQVPNPTENDPYNTREPADLLLPNVGYFDGDDWYVQKGIAALHQLGCEDSILASYLIPSTYLYSVYTYAGRLLLNCMKNNQAGLVATNLAYEYGYQARNKKVFCGECNAYMIYAKANTDMQKFNPEDIVDVNPFDPTQVGPTFRIFADVRPNTGAMCMPLTINKDVTRWYLNTVRELPYQSVPLKFDGASGGIIDTLNTRYSLNTKMADFRQKYPVAMNGAVGLTLDEGINYATMDFKTTMQEAGAGAKFLGGIGSGNYADAFGAAIEGGAALADQLVMNPGLKQATLEIGNRRGAYYATEMAQEKMALKLRTQYVAPQIRFQASQTMRELIGNGFLIVKYQMCVDDLMRCDKLLTMYGYKLTKSLEKTDLTNRPKFNYIEAGDVHITTMPQYTGAPKWLIEGAEQQISAGCRIWHVQFDPAFYTSNE